jgi:Zn-dependent M28 family amino/carboxypeptidase
MKFTYLLPLIVLLSCGTPHAQEQLKLLKDVEVLSSDAYEGRKTGTKGAEMARIYIKDRFKSIGLKAYPSLRGYEQSFTFNNGGGKSVTGTNLVAYLPGKSEEVIVISAHYDHIGVIKGEVYNGADDNASGVAALLHIAEYYAKKKPENTLVFAAFDAEEMGLRGSKAFVANPPVPLDKIQLNINMDMISHNDKEELYVCGTFSYPQLKPYIYTSVPNIKILTGHDDPATGREDWTDQSDQAAFHEKKIPFLYFGVEDHKDYHKASDEYKNINNTFFINATKAILEIIENIDKKRDMQKEFRDTHKMKKQ